MHVFLSWSGPRSKAVAELLHTWLPCVIQALKPWVSTQDLERGCLWTPELNAQLKDSLVGIVCLTLDNRTAPWILFEAGALAKGLSKSRVCTFLIDLRHQDVTGPLAQFNHTGSNKEDVWKLVQTLNNQLADGRLPEKTLDRVFINFWPQFEAEFKAVLDRHPQDPSARPRDSAEMLAEVLSNSRDILHRVTTAGHSRSTRTHLLDDSVRFSDDDPPTTLQVASVGSYVFTRFEIDTALNVLDDGEKPSVLMSFLTSHGMGSGKADALINYAHHLRRQR